MKKEKIRNVINAVKISKKFTKGFTLLELLVVVLIIGILAGIALPQYRRAVGKAELAQVISATKAVQNAQDRFYLVNNKYATSFDMLDINLPSNNVICRVGVYWSICNNKNYSIAHYNSQDKNNPNRMECYARNQEAAFACKDFIGKTPELTADGVCETIGVKPCWGASKVLPM